MGELIKGCSYIDPDGKCLFCHGSLRSHPDNIFYVNIVGIEQIMVVVDVYHPEHSR